MRSCICRALLREEGVGQYYHLRYAKGFGKTGTANVDR